MSRVPSEKTSRYVVGVVGASTPAGATTGSSTIGPACAMVRQVCCRSLCRVEGLKAKQVPDSHNAFEARDDRADHRDISCWVIERCLDPSSQTMEG